MQTNTIELPDSQVSALSYGARDGLIRTIIPYIEALEEKGHDVSVKEISIFPAQYSLLAMSIKRVQKLKHYPIAFMFRGYKIKPL